VILFLSALLVNFDITKNIVKLHDKEAEYKSWSLCILVRLVHEPGNKDEVSFNLVQFLALYGPK
jgi:SPX domain protein involved in polyphosphate accumulation